MRPNRPAALRFVRPYGWLALPREGVARTMDGHDHCISTPPEVQPLTEGEVMIDSPRRFVQVIDLYSRHPAELERLLNRWRASSLAREHIAGVELGRDEGDEQHLVLQVEYESATSASDPVQPSAEAAGVVALLDRPPHFRTG